jgi:predicted glutamine amidotransferase
MHNGLIGSFEKVERQLRHQLSDESYQWIHGTTDSEIAFAVFRDAYAKCENNDETQRIADALSAAIHSIVDATRDVGCDKESRLNLAVADGQRAVVSRFTTGDVEPPSLYYRAGDEYICENGSCRMVDFDGHPSSLIVASEPLTQDEEGWILIPRNHMLLIEEDFTVRLQAI